MTYRTGGPESLYYTGLILVLVGMPVLLSITPLESLAISLPTCLGFGLSPLVTSGPLRFETFGISLIFVGSGALESFVSCLLLTRARVREFEQRREIERARDELKQLDREKSRFTANVHHELRTPLTLTLAPLEGLLAGEFGAVSELQRSYLKTMHANALRLLKLINNLLDLAKIESRQLEIRRRKTDLASLVLGLLEGARPLAERKGVAVSWQGFEGLAPLHLDPDAIEKVVVNLVGNALKFTESGGRIEVRAEPAEPGQEGGAHLVVADTGLGIPSDQLERIFDRFAQVDASSTRRHEGTGIGLSLARELVELHGGRIWAESEGLGQGTSVHVVLPPGEADAPAEEELLEGGAAAAGAPRGKALAAMEADLDFEPRDRAELSLIEVRRHVARERGESEVPGAEAPGAAAPADAPELLICEDNADMRRLLAFLLGKEFRVRLARNGREGLESARAGPPDLVLTDVMMPELSGTELCRALKADPATRGIPVVLVTSKAEREMKIEGLELGADDYVTKPFHPRELLARVRSLVRLHRLQAELALRNQELQRSNAELARALAELREAEVQVVQAERLAAVGELAAGIAHEVNNPVNFAQNALRTLRSYVEDLCRFAEEVAALPLSDPGGLPARLAGLAKRRQELGIEELAEGLGELVGIAGEGLERTQRLVGDLRDFAAPGAGPRRPVDLGRGLRSTLALVQHAMARAGVRVEVEIPAALPPVLGDAGALNQVFLNLLKNAAEALEGRGGTVRVTARPAGASVAVEIRDDGPGIAPEVRARLFEPFFSTKEAGRGTGLGLSICRRIAAEHGGRVEVESEAGAGTTFTVVLPAQEGAGLA
jgi:signal transduction histidine kinase